MRSRRSKVSGDLSDRTKRVLQSPSAITAFMNVSVTRTELLAF